MEYQSAVSSILKSHSDPLFTPSEAADYLNVSERTLSVWRCTGRYGISFLKVGRKVRYRKSALDAFLDRRIHGAVEEKGGRNHG